MSFETHLDDLQAHASEMKDLSIDMADSCVYARVGDILLQVVGTHIDDDGDLIIVTELGGYNGLQ